jgi:hypothetical protein
MPNLTQLLKAAQTGDPQAAADLLPLVYEELRAIAAARIAAEATEHPGHDCSCPRGLPAACRTDRRAGLGESGHFFAAASEAMRRILVDYARCRKAAKRGAAQRVTVDLDRLSAIDPDDDVLAVHDALDQIAECRIIRSPKTDFRHSPTSFAHVAIRRVSV